MFNLFPISLLIMGLGGALYIISNHLSAFEENGETDGSEFSLKAKLADWINQLPLDAAKARSLSSSQKFLHKARLVLLKTDNHLMKLIGKISEKDKAMNGASGSGNNNADFWKDFASEKKESAPSRLPESASKVKINLALKSNPEMESFLDIKPAVKVNKVVRRTRKKSANANVAQSVEQLHGKE